MKIREKDMPDRAKRIEEKRQEERRGSQIEKEIEWERERERGGGHISYMNVIFT